MLFLIHLLSLFKAAGISQSIDKTLSAKIDLLVKEGVSNVNEIRRNLKIVVKKDIFGDDASLPDRANKRFFPTPCVMRSHIVRAK